MFEILLRVSEGKPWKETLLEVLPQRKFVIGGKKRKHKSNDTANEIDNDDQNSTNNDTSREKIPNENSVS